MHFSTHLLCQSVMLQLSIILRFTWWVHYCILLSVNFYDWHSCFLRSWKYKWPYTNLMKLQNEWNDNYSTIQCTLKFMCISNRYCRCCCCYYYCIKNFILSAAILSTLYFWQPFFAPVCLHVLLAAIKELKRYKAERAKYSAFLATRAASS